MIERHWLVHSSRVTRFWFFCLHLVLLSPLSFFLSLCYRQKAQWHQLCHPDPGSQKKNQSVSCHVTCWNSTMHEVKAIASVSKVSTAEDGLVMRSSSPQGARLSNSEVLSDLPSYLSHLPDSQRCDIVNLLSNFQNLFRDIPSSTKPIKQCAYRASPEKREIMRKVTIWKFEEGW